MSLWNEFVDAFYNEDSVACRRLLQESHHRRRDELGEIEPEVFEICVLAALAMSGEEDYKVVHAAMHTLSNASYWHLAAFYSMQLAFQLRHYRDAWEYARSINLDSYRDDDRLIRILDVRAASALILGKYTDFRSAVAAMVEQLKDNPSRFENLIGWPPLAIFGIADRILSENEQAIDGADARSIRGTLQNYVESIDLDYYYGQSDDRKLIWRVLQRTT